LLCYLTGSAGCCKHGLEAGLLLQEAICLTLALAF
jgi:hypothetical protein